MKLFYSISKIHFKIFFSHLSNPSQIQINMHNLSRLIITVNVINLPADIKSFAIVQLMSIFLRRFFLSRVNQLIKFYECTIFFIVFRICVCEYFWVSIAFACFHIFCSVLWFAFFMKLWKINRQFKFQMTFIAKCSLFSSLLVWFHWRWPQFQLEVDQTMSQWWMSLATRKTYFCHRIRFIRRLQFHFLSFFAPLILSYF